MSRLWFGPFPRCDDRRNRSSARIGASNPRRNALATQGEMTRPTSDTFFSLLGQHDFDGADARRRTFLGGQSFRGNTHVADVRVGDEPSPDDLGDVDGARD